MNKMDSSNHLQGRLRKLLHYWFIQYNPLYFVSALCVLFGMFLVSRGLVEMGWTRGQMLLTAVIQAYEILLIVGAAILFRLAGEYRPAVILGLLEVFFLYDCTFQTEIIATFERIGIVLTVGWIALVALKLMALARAFRLKIVVFVLIIPVLAAIGVAGTPYLLKSAMIEKNMAHLLATWLGVALVFSVLWIRPKVTCAIPLEEWGQTVLRRATKSAWMIWAGFYFYHIITWFGMFDITFALAPLVPFFLLVPFKFNTEESVWASGLGAFAFSLMQMDFFTFSPIMLMTGVAFGLQAWRMRQNRLYLGALVSLHIACWTIGWHTWPPPAQNWWLNLATGSILLLMAWRLRLTSALLIAILGILPVLKKVVIAIFSFIKAVILSIYSVLKSFLPQSLLGWGILLLAVGFMALIIGVAINWTQRQKAEN